MLLGLAMTLPADAATSRKKSAASTAKKASSSKTVSGKPAGSKSKRRTQAARRSGPARQMSPTPERYMQIQQALADKGYYEGPVNGQWGPESVDALKRFQQDANLVVDGKLGALSIIALGLGPNHDASTQFAVKPGSIE